MDKYEYFWMRIRNNMLPGDISGAALLDENVSNFKDEVLSYEEIMNMDTMTLQEKTCLTKKQAEYIMSTKAKYDINREYEMFLASNAKSLTLKDEEYPKRLRYIDNPPFAIFYYGDLPLEELNSVAIIGARKCSEYGKIMARNLATDLSKSGVNIISGMAYGIDGIAQETALFSKKEGSSNSSYAVLGSGVDVCYPKANEALYNKLKLMGGIISEYPVGAEALADNFPLRNRIISALSDIVIVVESRLKSGTFITVDYALTQGKEIMVVPGRVTDPLSVGCNALISQGAVPVQSADDVLRLFETILPRTYDTKNKASNFRTKELKKLVPKPQEKILLEREENLVYSVLDFYSLSPEDISQALNMDIFQVMSILIRLEMKGIITETGKNLYVKCR